LSNRSRKGSPPTPLGEIAPAVEDSPEIRKQLERILDSPAFRNSKRCSDFLRFVVEQTCEGHPDILKERTLGMTIFDREPDYDTNRDPIVRNTAGQVRKRLAQYYYEAAPGEPRIELPAGSYVPEIHLPKVDNEELAPLSIPIPTSGTPSEPEFEEAPEPPRSLATPEVLPPEKLVEPAPAALPVLEPGPTAPKPHDRRLLWIALFLLGVALGGWALWSRLRTDALQAFWTPVLKQDQSVVVCVGQGHTYRIPTEMNQWFDRPGGLTATPPAPGQIDLKDVRPAYDRYVALTDSQAAMRLSSLFTRFGQEVSLRGGRSTSLADLRGKPVVLVGGFNNAWTLRLTGELRFYFDSDAQEGVEYVKDRQRPDHHSWNVPTEAESQEIRRDYAIVTRVQNPATEQTVVVAAGIRGGGTLAAAEFLTHTEYLEKALAHAPRGWKGKNVQFVLSVPVYGGTPGPPEVIASHFW
jgi:hypothetical protein